MPLRDSIQITGARFTGATVIVTCAILGACASGPGADQALDSAHAVGLACSSDSIQPLLQRTIAEMHTRNPTPGISAAVYAPQLSLPIAATVGKSAFGDSRPLAAGDRFLAGSVGKTFFAALALRAAASGTLDLDTPVSRYLGDLRIPSFNWITPRMLLTHTSGIGEYDGPFMTALIREPTRERTRGDWLDVVRRTPPARASAGQFRYSDVNYVVLAMVLDETDADGAYGGIAREFTRPLGLRSTTPSVMRQIEGLVPGYEAAASMFGQEAMIVDGSLIYNPQFEWGGGGFVSTPSDLARWMSAFRNGKAFPDSMWPAVVARPPGVPDTVESWRGMGVHVGRGAIGNHVGHSGYMPGYVSWVRWYDSLGVSIAMQTNATDEGRLPDNGFDWIDSIGARLGRRCHQK